jgi:hypothetical protein
MNVLLQANAEVSFAPQLEQANPRAELYQQHLLLWYFSSCSTLFLCSQCSGWIPETETGAWIVQYDKVLSVPAHAAPNVLSNSTKYWDASSSTTGWWIAFNTMEPYKMCGFRYILEDPLYAPKNFSIDIASTDAGPWTKIVEFLVPDNDNEAGDVLEFDDFVGESTVFRWNIQSTFTDGVQGPMIRYVQFLGGGKRTKCPFFEFTF